MEELKLCTVDNIYLLTDVWSMRWKMAIEMVFMWCTQGYCAKHSKKLEPDGTPRKATSSTPKKHMEMTEEEKKAAKARK